MSSPQKFLFFCRIEGKFGLTWSLWAIFCRLIPDTSKVLKAKLALWVRRKFTINFYWGGFNVELILVTTPFFSLKTTSLNCSMVLVLTSTLSFKDPCWFSIRAFLSFKLVEACCLKVTWFPRTITTPFWVGNFST